MAWRMAKVAPICPMLLPPSTTSAATESLMTRGSPAGSTPPSLSLRTYSGTRKTPWEWHPLRSATTKVSVNKAASREVIPQLRKIADTIACRFEDEITTSRLPLGYPAIPILSCEIHPLTAKTQRHEETRIRPARVEEETIRLRRIPCRILPKKREESPNRRSSRHLLMPIR